MIFVEPIPNEVRPRIGLRQHLLSFSSVLPCFMDTQAPAEAYGLRPALVRPEFVVLESVWRLFRQRPRVV
jgi:hypothetical protein